MKGRKMRMERQKLSRRRKSIIELCVYSTCFFMLLISSTVMAYEFANNNMFPTSNETSKIDTTNISDKLTATAGVISVTNDMLVSAQVCVEDRQATISGSSLEIESGCGVASETINIYQLPDTTSEVFGQLYWNEYVEYSVFSEDWYRIEFGSEDLGYIEAKYINTSEATYNYSKDVSGDKRKSYMDYRTITTKSSPQYKIQSQYAYTNYNGIRMAEGRFLVAVGSYYGVSVGQCIDVELSDGSILPCIVGDAKANRDTNGNHSVGKDGSTVEFIVDKKQISSATKSAGDVSAIEGMSEKVVKIHVYDRNILSN